MFTIDNLKGMGDFETLSTKCVYQTLFLKAQGSIQKNPKMKLARSGRGPKPVCSRHIRMDVHMKPQ